MCFQGQCLGHGLPLFILNFPDSEIHSLIKKNHEAINSVILKFAPIYPSLVWWKWITGDAPLNHVPLATHKELTLFKAGFCV